MTEILNTLKYGERALDYVRALAGVVPNGRGSAAPSEARAAEYVRQQFVSLGVNNVSTQAFVGLRSLGLFHALAFGFALMGHAAYWLLRPPLGGWFALAVSLLAFGVGGVILWRKFTFHAYPLQNTLPHGPSQNVIAQFPSVGAASQQVVFLAHLDSHRAVWWYASEALTALYLAASPLAVGGFALAPLLYLLAEIIQNSTFTWGAAILALLHFIGWFTGATADLGPNSPGANDNASAVGTLLTLAERLQAEPLQHTQVCLAFTGCEEVAAEGMRALLDEFGEPWKNDLFVDFEMVGIGDRLIYLQSEGVVRRRRIPSEVESLVLEVGAPYHVEPQGIAALGTLTEIGVVLERGLKGVCLMTRRAGSPFMPEWHRLTDTPDRLEPAALQRAHDFAWTLLQHLDTA